MHRRRIIRRWHRYSLCSHVRKLPGHVVPGGSAASARFSRETGSNFKHRHNPHSPNTLPSSPSLGDPHKPDPLRRERHGEDRAASFTACCCHGNSVFQKPPSLGLYTIKKKIKKNPASRGYRDLCERRRGVMSTCAHMALCHLIFFLGADPYSYSMLTVIWSVNFTVWLQALRDTTLTHTSHTLKHNVTLIKWMGSIGRLINSTHRAGSGRFPLPSPCHEHSSVYPQP